MPKNNQKTLVVASAGNTGRAFANICSQHQIPLYLVIPETSLSAMWSKDGFDPCVRLIVVGGNGDYFDAIRLAKIISQLDDFFPEGGGYKRMCQDYTFEKSEEPTIKFFKEIGLKPILVDFKDHYVFGGGLHCATCDVRRRGMLKSYF